MGDGEKCKMFSTSIAEYFRSNGNTLCMKGHVHMQLFKSSEEDDSKKHIENFKCGNIKSWKRWRKQRGRRNIKAVANWVVHILIFFARSVFPLITDFLLFHFSFPLAYLIFAYVFLHGGRFFPLHSIHSSDALLPIDSDRASVSSLSLKPHTARNFFQTPETHFFSRVLIFIPQSSTECSMFADGQLHWSGLTFLFFSDLLFHVFLCLLIISHPYLSFSSVILRV